MITLERVTSEDFPGQVWTDDSNTHVIVQETEETAPITTTPGWYVRDEFSELGPFSTAEVALESARLAWGDAVALGPALRLERNIAGGRADEVGHFLLEYLAEYGAVGIDVKDLAENVLTMAEGE